MKATLVKDNLEGFSGHAALYRMDPPLNGCDFVIASAISKTCVFPADAGGEVVSWAEMDGSYRGGLSHAKAFAGAGYSMKLPAEAADSPPVAQANALTDSYVQRVPDKCDRIVWRGSYYCLPLSSPTQTADSVQWQCGPQASGFTTPQAGMPTADYDHGPQSKTVQEAARNVGKWLNERPNRPLDLRDVAMLSAHAQATEGMPEDAARLDWLLGEGRNMAIDSRDGEYRVVDDTWGLVVTDWMPTPRAAIDAARKQGANHD